MPLKSCVCLITHNAFLATQGRNSSLASFTTVRIVCTLHCSMNSIPISSCSMSPRIGRGWEDVGGKSRGFVSSSFDSRSRSPLSPFYLLIGAFGNRNKSFVANYSLTFRPPSHDKFNGAWNEFGVFLYNVLDFFLLEVFESILLDEEAKGWGQRVFSLGHVVDSSKTMDIFLYSTFWLDIQKDSGWRMEHPWFLERSQKILLLIPPVYYRRNKEAGKIPGKNNGHDPEWQRETSGCTAPVIFSTVRMEWADRTYRRTLWNGISALKELSLPNKTYCIPIPDSLNARWVKRRRMIWERFHA